MADNAPQAKRERAQGTVTIAGRQYTIEPLPIKASQAWRKKFSEPFGAIAGVLTTFGSQESLRDIQLTAVSDVVEVIRGKLLGSMELALELLYDYSPAIQNDKEHIEANGYDDEVIDALLEVLKLAYPFGRAFDFVKAGPATQPTLKN